MRTSCAIGGRRQGSRLGVYESYIPPITALPALGRRRPAAGIDSARLHLTLIGIVRERTIMTIDFALKTERGQARRPGEAIYQACRLRLRPIMRTTFAAIGGVPPNNDAQSAALAAPAPDRRRHHSATSPTRPRRNAMTITTKIRPWITITNSPNEAR